MADITSYYQGNVEPSGKVNWRGDQVSVPQGGQSIYETSSVKLTDLGSRKVVGDRVFRYAQAAGAIGAGDLAQYGGTQLINVTAGDTNPAGGKIFTWYAATTIGKDDYAEGYLISQSGTAANMGFIYRVKSHDAIATTTKGDLTLYDELVRQPNTADKWSLHMNLYKNVTEMTAGTAPAVGVAPVAVTSGDYFWIQTWGPACVKCAAVGVGQKVVAGDTGEVKAPVATTGAQVGYALQTLTASERGLVFLTIAP